MTEPFTVLIPDRGDRPEFTERCFFQLSRQTLQPDHIVHVNYSPTTTGFDLSERVQYGLRQAKTDIVAIIENDDYYPENYLEIMLSRIANCEIAGIDRTTYYNIRTLTYKVLQHFTPPRSSFAFTVFRKSAFTGFIWPRNQNPLVDMALWTYAVQKQKKIGITLDVYPVSIKHGVGLCGVQWHYRDIAGHTPDPAMQWLKEHTDDIMFEFYQSWHTRNK